ncbi:MAG: GTPase Era [bacterium]|nr:GTPase Era [bacterium]
MSEATASGTPSEGTANEGTATEVATRCGTVAIVGRPNVGKSTLLNAILDAHLSIVTPKAQTTRKRVLGIATDENAQLIFIDTPGLIKPKYKMQHSMMGYVDDSLNEADVLCVVVDVVKAFDDKTILDTFTTPILTKYRDKPAVLVLNKMDALHLKTEALFLMEEARLSGFYKRAVAVSALENKEVDALVDILKGLVPKGPFLYDKDQLSTLPERFFVAELIREAIYFQYREEVPYSTDVTIVEFEERENGKWYIAADIIVERETQKGILIGAQGEALKMVGEFSRAAIEKHLQHPVFLELYVKVRQDWRNDKAQLTGLGY